jgi:hypothetical protein
LLQVKLCKSTSVRLHVACSAHQLTPGPTLARLSVSLASSMQLDDDPKSSTADYIIVIDAVAVS